MPLQSLMLDAKISYTILLQNLSIWYIFIFPLTLFKQCFLYLIRYQPYHRKALRRPNLKMPQTVGRGRPSYWLVPENQQELRKDEVLVSVHFLWCDSHTIRLRAVRIWTFSCLVWCRVPYSVGSHRLPVWYGCSGHCWRWSCLQLSSPRLVCL